MNDRAMQKWAAELRETRPWTERQARDVLERQRASGAGVTAFARRIGVTPQRLFWWRTRLEADAPCVVRAEPLKEAPRFVPVVVKPCDDDHANDHAPLVVRIGEHVRIDVRHPDASTAAWVALLAAGCTDGGLP